MGDVEETGGEPGVERPLNGGQRILQLEILTDGTSYTLDVTNAGLQSCIVVNHAPWRLADALNHALKFVKEQALFQFIKAVFKYLLIAFVSI